MKTIQIATTCASNQEALLFVLREDGSIWWLVPRDKKDTWERLPDVPSEPSTEDLIDRDLAAQALGDAIERPHGGRLAEAIDAIARYMGRL